MFFENSCTQILKIQILKRRMTYTFSEILQNIREFFSDTAGQEPSTLLKNEQFHRNFSTILPTLNVYFEHICMSASEVTQML